MEELINRDTDRNSKTGRFIDGNQGGGRPKGQRNYATIYREALKKIAEAQSMTCEEIEEELHRVGIEKALGGDYGFYRDVLDRLNGKPTQTTVLNTGGSQMCGVVILPERESSS